MTRHDSMTIHRAMQSEHADRLVEIAVEHARLAREAITLRHGVDAEIIDERIQQLRQERDGILEMFEGE